MILLLHQVTVKENEELRRSSLFTRECVTQLGHVGSPLSPSERFERIVNTFDMIALFGFVSVNIC